MFVGHFAVALAAKKAAPETSLGTLVLGAQFVDLLWPALGLLGLEHARLAPGITAVTPLDFYDYPITHSLAGAVLWSLVVGALYFAACRRARNTAVVAGAVLSHWILDFVAHRPDLPLWFSGGPYMGLGLWNSFSATVIVETVLLALGLWLYLSSTRAKDRIGVWSFWSFIAFLAVIHTANLAGPPPPDIMSVFVVGNAGWLFVAWAYWIDRHREVRTNRADVVSSRMTIGQ